MKVLVVADVHGDGFLVWVTLPHVETADLPHSHEAFVIASGLTPADARRNGITALEDARAQLVDVTG